MSKPHTLSPASSATVRGGTRALSLGFGLLLFAGGCGGGAEKLDHGRGGAFTPLGFDEATLHSDGTPRFLAGHMVVSSPIKDGSDAARVLQGQLGASYRLAAETSFSLINERRDDDGRRFFRLQQRHDGLRVIGREVAVQIGKDGAIEALLGQLTPELNLQKSTTPALVAQSGDAVLAAAMNTLALSPGRILKTPELAIYIDEGTSTGRLVYGALVDYRAADGRHIEELYVSAEDGSVVLRLSQIYTAGLDRKVYDLAKKCLVDGSELPGTLAISEGGTTTNVPAQRAYDNSGKIYWFFKHMFSRSSYDDKDATFTSSVMGTFDTGLGMGACDGGNAAWIPDPFNQMVYGNGSLFGFLLKEMTLGFDVAAHEHTHAVTFATSKLEYKNEPGALNEANSDIMGAAIEAWAASGGGAAGNPASITLSDKTWKIGEDVAGPLLPGGVIRQMSNPTIDMVSKDYYPERYIGMDDNGGVHINSGIPNLAFYLMVVGGSHPRTKTTQLVGALGIDKAIRILYQANLSLYTSLTDFQGARYATARAAENLYGRCGSEWANVHRAWDAVGVPGDWSPCVTPPGGF
jgi:bacillolysin